VDARGERFILLAVPPDFTAASRQRSQRLNASAATGKRRWVSRG